MLLITPPKTSGAPIITYNSRIKGWKARACPWGRDLILSRYQFYTNGPTESVQSPVDPKGVVQEHTDGRGLGTAKTHWKKG